MTPAHRLHRPFPGWAVVAAALVAALGPAFAREGPMGPSPSVPRLSDIDRCNLTFGESRPLGEDAQEYGGYVDLDCGSFRIQADRLVHDRRLRTARAEGHVSLSWQGNRLAGSSLLFHLDTETGEVQDAMGIFPPDAIVTAERMEKVSDDVVIIIRGVFTSCTQPVPYWAFRIRRGRFHLNHYAHLRGVTMTAGRVPVFHTPWLVWPIKGERATGFLFPQWGASSYFGTFFGDQFFWPMADNADLTLQADWYEKAGVGGGLEFNWLPDARGKIQFGGYALNDTQAGRSRHIAALRASQSFGGWHMVADLNEVSDFRYYTDFSRTLLAASTLATVSTARLTHSWSYYSFAARLDDSTQYFLQSQIGTSRLREQLDQRSLPEVELRGASRRLWELPLYFSFQTRGNWIDRHDESFVSDTDLDGREGGVFQASYGRFDAAGRLSLPLVPAPWLDLEVATELRQTWWGAGQASLSTEQDGTLRTGGVVETGGLHRSFGQLSFEATGPKFFRTWETEGGHRYKHVLEPRLLWQVAPQADYREQLRDGAGRPVTDSFTGEPVLAVPIPYDEIEALNNAFGPVDQVTYGLRQRLLARRRAAPPLAASPQKTPDPGVGAPPWGPGSLAPEVVSPPPPALPEVYPAPPPEGPGFSGAGSPVASASATDRTGEESDSAAFTPVAAPAGGEDQAGQAPPPAGWPWAGSRAAAVVAGLPAASASRPGMEENPVEIASLEISQSWSLEVPLLSASRFHTDRLVDPDTGQVTYQSVLTDRRTSARGPITIQGRVNPSLNFSLDLRASYDVLENRFSSETLSASLRSGRLGYANLAWVRTVAVGSAVSASGGVALFDRRLTTDLRFSWDSVSSRLVDQGVRVGYYTQCCGFLSEWYRRDFLGNQRNEIRFLLDLKGIGKFLDLKTGTTP